MILQEPVTPHDLEAEHWVLGGIMATPVLYAHVADILTASAFWRTEHQAVYAAMERAAIHGYSPDVGAVLRELAAVSSQVEPAYVWSLYDGMPRGVNVREYAQRIAARFDERRWIELAAKMREAAYAGDDIAAVLEEMPAPRTGAPTTSLTAEEQADALEADLVRDLSGPKVWLGLPAIDNCLQGVQPGEVLGVLARPSVGKTLVLCHMLHGLADDVNALCYSLEMPAAQIARRLARMALGLGARDLAQGRFDRAAYAQRFARLSLDATSGLTVPQMRLRAQALQRTARAPVAILIDHLGMIGGDGKLPTYDRVSKQARELKDMAKALDVAVVVLIQVNRDKGGDGSRELELGSARDSGVVEEACDYMVGLRRLDRGVSLPIMDREHYRDVIFAKPLKNRHGTLVEEVGYRMDPDTLRLREDSQIKAPSGSQDVSDRVADLRNRGHRP